MFSLSCFLAEGEFLKSRRAQPQALASQVPWDQMSSDELGGSSLLPVDPPPQLARARGRTQREVVRENGATPQVGDQPRPDGLGYPQDSRRGFLTIRSLPWKKSDEQKPNIPTRLPQRAVQRERQAGPRQHRVARFLQGQVGEKAPVPMPACGKTFGATTGTPYMTASLSHACLRSRCRAQRR